MAKPQKFLQLHALVVFKDCKRCLVVDYGDVNFVVEDGDPSSQRSALELLDAWCKDYQDQLTPHLRVLTRMRALALALRRSQPKPNLP